MTTPTENPGRSSTNPVKHAMIPTVTTATTGDPMAATLSVVPDGKTQCTAHARSGNPCRQPAVAGATVCRFHGGGAPQVRAAAARRLAERQAYATLADVEVRPISNPLEALAEVAEEMRAFMTFAGAEVAQLTELTTSNDAGTEHIAAVVALYERSADRCARLLADWVRLGFDERMTNLAERQAELVEQYLLAVVADLSLTDEQTALVPDAAVRHLTVLTGQQAA